MEGSNKTVGIIGAVVAVVLVAGGIWWFANRDDNKQTATNETTQTSQTEQQSSPNIVVLATQTSDLSTLVTAVKAANLVDTLQGAGPFTVFAPTNAAFSALPAGTVENLLKPENIEQLKSILTYHVVAGKVLASDLKDGQVIKTVQGENITVKITDGMVYLIDAKGNQVKVEKADVNAENGVVHIINGVLLP